MGISYSIWNLSRWYVAFMYMIYPELTCSTSLLKGLSIYIPASSPGSSTSDWTAIYWLDVLLWYARALPLHLFLLLRS